MFIKENKRLGQAVNLDGTSYVGILDSKHNEPWNKEIKWFSQPQPKANLQLHLLYKCRKDLQTELITQTTKGNTFIFIDFDISDWQLEN